MITCAFYNLQTFQSDGIHEVITVQNDDGSPVNLTAATVTMYGRLSLDASTNLFSLGVGTGITLSDPTNGTFTVAASGSTCGFGTLVYDQGLDDKVSIPYWVEITPSGGTLQTILYGPLTVSRN